MVDRQLGRGDRFPVENKMTQTDEQNRHHFFLLNQDGLHELSFRQKVERL